MIALLRLNQFLSINLHKFVQVVPHCYQLYLVPTICHFCVRILQSRFSHLMSPIFNCLFPFLCSLIERLIWKDLTDIHLTNPMSCLHLLTLVYTHLQRCKHIRIYLSQNQWKICSPMSSFNINKNPGYTVTHPFSGLLISLSPINTVHIWLFWRQPKNGIIEQNYINHAKLRHGTLAPCSTKYQCRKLILDISSTRLYYK